MQSNDRQRFKELFTSFREVNQSHYRVLQVLTKKTGITPIQFYALRILSDHPGIGLGEFSQLLRSTNSTASGIIDRMVKNGWVSRETPETDRRSVVLSLTQGGEQMWREANEFRLDYLKPLVEKLTDDEHKQLLQLHGKIISILQEIKESEQ